MADAGFRGRPTAVRSRDDIRRFHLRVLADQNVYRYAECASKFLL